MNSKFAFLILTLASILTAFAAEVDQVVVRQQWPWSTDIKVEYKLTNVTAPVDLTVKAYDGDTELALPADSITGDRYGISDSVGTLFIDPVKAFGTGKVAMSAFKVRVDVADATNSVKTLYKIFDLTDGTYQDVTGADILNGKMGAFETDFSKIGEGFNTSLSDVIIWTGVTNDAAYMTSKLVMRRVPGGGKTFTMGSSSDEIGHEYDSPEGSEAQREVTLGEKDYYMSVFPLTFGQIWKFAANKTASYVQLWSGKYIYTGGTYSEGPYSEETLQTTEFPCYYTYDAVRGKEKVWPEDGHDVVSGNLLGRMRNLLNVELDIPTEAQWEFACRAGTTTALNNGKNLVNLSGGGNVGDLAWIDANSDNAIHPVGQKKPNALGIYDMHGGLFELCLDYYSADVSKLSGPDVGGPKTEDVTCEVTDRVMKGGVNLYAACYTRSAARRKWDGSNNTTISHVGVRSVMPAAD